MQSKPCTKCGELKQLTDFGVRRSSKDGLSFQCRACVRARNDAYYLADKSKSAAQRADNYARNQDRLLQYRRDHYLAKRETHLKRMKSHRDRNLEAYRERSRSWARNNRKTINDSLGRKRVSDPSFRQKEALRGVLRACLLRIGAKKEGKTVDILGYSAADLASRMEVQFQRGMDWKNYGEWHIDHKIPVAHFTRKREWRPEIINALCNLQPLWAADNLRKRNKLPAHLLERA